MKKISPTVELTLPVLPDMEIAAKRTGEVVAKHMGLDEEKTAEMEGRALSVKKRANRMQKQVIAKGDQVLEKKSSV